MKKIKSCKIIRSFFNSCSNQVQKDVVWLVRKFKHKITVIQKAWRYYYPRFEAELKALEACWQHMVSVNKRRTEGPLSIPSTRARMGSFFFGGNQSSLAPPPSTDSVSTTQTSSMGDVTISTMLPSFRPTKKSSFESAEVNNSTRRFSISIVPPPSGEDMEPKLFEMKNMPKSIDLNIIPADYNEADRKVLLKAVWRERKIKFEKDLQAHKLKLETYLRENLSGILAARNLLSRKERLTKKLFRDEFLSMYPTPKWKAIPRPSELQELLNIQSFLIKPTRFQHSSLLKKPIFTATGERAPAQVQYIIITLLYFYDNFWFL